MTQLESLINTRSSAFQSNAAAMRQLVDDLLDRRLALRVARRA